MVGGEGGFEDGEEVGWRRGCGDAGVVEGSEAAGSTGGEGGGRGGEGGDDGDDFHVGG